MSHLIGQKFTIFVYHIQENGIKINSLLTEYSIFKALTKMGKTIYENWTRNFDH